LLAVVVLVLLSTFVHLWWLNRFRDGFPLDIDESRYLQFGMSLKDALADGGVRGFWRIWEAQQDFGPLLPLTSVAVYVILGESVLNGMATQLVFFAVLALASYGIGTRLTSRTGGALVALVVATAPAVVDFTRTYQFPVTAAAMLAASTYALLASDGLSRRDWSIAWGTLLGLTALARTMMIAFIPVQVVAALWLALGRPGARRQRAENLAIGTAAGVLTASVWFATSWGSVVDYLTNFGYGDRSASFGTEKSRLSVGYWTQELVETVREDLYLPLSFLLVLALGLGLGAFALRLRQRGASPPWRTRLRAWTFTDTAVVLFVVVTAYVLLTSSRNQGVGFRVPVVAGVVALVVASIWSLPWRRVRAALIAGLIAVSAVNAVMKADVVKAVSGAEIVDVPGVAAAPVLKGRGYIQGYMVGALEANPPSATEPLPESQKQWLPAYRRLVAGIRGAARKQEDLPLVGLATLEPLLNPNNLTLAARLTFHQDLPVAALSAPPRGATLGSYRTLLSQAPCPSVLITVSRLGLSYRVLTGEQTLDQKLLRRAAASLGFARLVSVALPNARHAIVMRRPPTVPSCRGIAEAGTHRGGAMETALMG
jgi:4-amino-4-deoxy-L-arabinose transferase-like glycosyltransferase